MMPGFFSNCGCNCVYRREHLLHCPCPSWMLIQGWQHKRSTWVFFFPRKRHFPRKRLHTVLGCSQGCPTCLCHKAATLRAAGSPVATGERDQSWDMIQKQTSATSTQLDLLGKIPKSENRPPKNQPGYWNIVFIPPGDVGEPSRVNTQVQNVPRLMNTHQWLLCWGQEDWKLEK